MAKTLAGRYGPWLHWSPIRTRRDLGDYWGGIRLVLDEQSGIILNIALVGLGGLVLGWYPKHEKCVTGYGVVLEPGEAVEPRHRCWARKLNFEWSLPEFEKIRRHRIP